MRDQVQVWSDSFDSNTSSILGLQQEISSAIAEQVRTRLSPERQRALARRQTQNADAYDFFLRGRHFLNQRTPEAMQLAIAAFQRATVADPAYSLGWANLAMAYGTSPINSDVDPRRVFPHAREAAVRAVAANPDVAEAQHALGHVNWAFEWDWPVAEAAFRRAIELDPSYSLVHLILARYVPPYALALVHAGLGDAEAAFEWLDRAYTARDVHLMFLAVDVKWDRYRADPRFGALLAHCGFTATGTPVGKALAR